MSWLNPAYGYDLIPSSRNGYLEIDSISTDYSKWSDIGCRQGRLHASLADKHVGTPVQVLGQVDLRISMSRCRYRLKSGYL